MRPWELWFADFPFEEDPGKIKNRPVIVLSVEPLQVLSVKVTSQRPRDADLYDTPIIEWKYAGLKSPSCARVSKTIFLSNEKFSKRIGILHDNDKKAIFEKYQEYLESLE